MLFSFHFLFCFFISSLFDSHSRCHALPAWCSREISLAAFQNQMTPSCFADHARKHRVFITPLVHMFSRTLLTGNASRLVSLGWGPSQSGRAFSLVLALDNRRCNRIVQVVFQLSLLICNLIFFPVVVEYKIPSSGFYFYFPLLLKEL